MKTTITLGLGAAVAIGTALGCAALSGLDPANQQPACLNQMDQPTLGALGTQQGIFLGALVSCSILKDPDQNAASMCIQSKTQLSPQCANCAAVIGTCATNNCRMQCTTGGSFLRGSDCQTCVSMACNPSLIACGGMPIYACNNPSDSDALMGHATGFETDLKTCTGMGDLAGVTGCLQQMDGLSPACATCYAEEALCVLAQCSMCDYNAPDMPCMDCIGSKCEPAFELCSGILDDGGLQPDGGGPG
jgi:hypothetical protein